MRKRKKREQEKERTKNNQEKKKREREANTVPVGLAVDVKVAGVVHLRAGLSRLALGRGDIHRLQDGLKQEDFY